MKAKPKTNKELFLVIIPIFIILMSSINLALEINVDGNLEVEEESLLELNITLKNVNGTTNLTKDLENGSITKNNNTHYLFEWTPEIGTAGTDNKNSYRNYEFEFTGEDNETITTKKITIKVTKKNIPPTITVSGGGNLEINEKRANITVEMNVPGTCKYDLSDKSYEQMSYTLLPDEDKIIHEGYTPTLSDGTHTIYVLCKDENQNYMEEPETITVKTLLSPEATITLDPSSPLKSGFIKIRLRTTVPLMDSPSLKYFFDDDLKEKSITLIGANKDWEGYMIIDETDKRRIGTFLYEGLGTNNLQGTRITDGKIFIVDTYYPGTVSSIKLENLKDSFKLSWKYLEEDSHNIKEYRIYRRVSKGGVDYTDYLETTTKNYFYDHDIKYDEAYYYKVSAVDHANNEGELSREVFETRIFIEEDEEEKTLDEDLVQILNKKIEEINIILININNIDAKLKRINKPGATDIMQTLNIIGKINNAKNEVENIKKDLNELREQNLTKTEFTEKTDILMLDANKALANLPNEVNIIDSAEYQELIDEDKTENAINAYLEHIKEDPTNKYLEENKQLQSSISTNTKIYNVKIKYEDGREEKYIIVKKTINAFEELNDIILLEQFPLNSNKNDIYFNKNPEFINDNLFYWTIPNLDSEEIYYAFRTNSEIRDVRNIKSIITKEQKTEKEPITGITGQATSTGEKISKHILFWPILISVIISVLLASYYFTYNELNNEKEGGFFSKLILSIRKKLTKNKRQILPKTNDTDKLIKIDKEPETETETEIILESHPEIEKKESEKEQETKEKPITKEKPVLEEIKEEVKITEEPKTNENVLDEIKYFRQKLKEYNKKIHKTNNLTSDEVKDLHIALDEIKKECETLEEKNLYGFVNKAKKDLEDVLSYIDKTKFLEIQASNGKEFILKNEKMLYCVKDLLKALPEMEDDIFEHHVNSEKNDFAEWILKVFLNEEIAKKIKEVKTKKEIIKILK